MERHHTLVVDDDPTFRRALLRMLDRAGGLGTPRAAATIAQAEAELARGQIAAGIVDVMLPDGSGLDLAARMRERDPMMPIMIVTAAHDPTVANRAQRLRADYVVKPPSQDNVRAFVEDSTWQLRIRRRHLARCLARFADRYGLTPREREVLELALRGAKRDAIARALGTRPATVKSHAARLLSKTNQPSLADLARAVLAEAWDITPPEPD